MNATRLPTSGLPLIYLEPGSRPHTHTLLRYYVAGFCSWLYRRCYCGKWRPRHGPLLRCNIFRRGEVGRCRAQRCEGQKRWHSPRHQIFYMQTELWRFCSTEPGQISQGDAGATSSICFSAYQSLLAAYMSTYVASKVNRPGLGHQRTSSTGRVASSRSPRDGSPVKPSSPARVTPVNVRSSPAASRAPLDSPTRRTHPTQNLSRSGSRRASLLSEAASPTVTRQRSFDSPSQEHATRSVSGSSSHASSPHPTSAPHQPSTLRRVSTPPPPIELDSDPESPGIVEEPQLVTMELPVRYLLNIDSVTC